MFLFTAIGLTTVNAAEPPPENPVDNEPPVGLGDGPAVSQDLVINQNYELILKQNATLMGKIDALTAKLNSKATTAEVNAAKFDVFEAIEYNTDPIKLNLPIVFMVVGLFAFMLFVFGAIETSRFAREKLRRNKLKCPKCGNYAPKIDSHEGNIYSCVCGAYFGEMNYGATEPETGGEI